MKHLRYKSASLVIALVLFSGMLFLTPSKGHSQTPKAWVVTKSQWSKTDELNFQSFVSAMGKAVQARQCFTTESCLKSPANPYRGSDSPSYRFYADCADLPYVLRAYFAWKNGLPFTWATQMTARPVDGNRLRDIRYTPLGNIVVKRNSVTTGHPNGYQLISSELVGAVSSAMFRTNLTDNDNALFTDFYPVKISRESIVPGTVIYDPAGHVVVVHTVSPDGRIFYFDAHPDNSLTAGVFNEKFVRSHPGQGAGFKNWRPVTVSNGRLTATVNKNLPLYGVEQFLGFPDFVNDVSRWNQAIYKVDGRRLKYYDFVRSQLISGQLKLNPLDEMQNTLEDLCVAIEDRVIAVDAALKAGIQNKQHPARLPLNIYGTDGEWETYSSPSRDARLKTVFKSLFDQTLDHLQRYAARDSSIVYNGFDLKKDLAKTYIENAQKCVITYTKTNGQKVSLNTEQVRQRLFKLSFDPYHCAELRWGAINSEELASCTDDRNKRDWYTFEQRLRNQIERKYDARMDFSLQELMSPSTNNGVEFPPETDLARILN